MPHTSASPKVDQPGSPQTLLLPPGQFFVCPAWTSIISKRPAFPRLSKSCQQALVVCPAGAHLGFHQVVGQGEGWGRDSPTCGHRRTC